MICFNLVESCSGHATTTSQWDTGIFRRGQGEDVGFHEDLQTICVANVQQNARSSQRVRKHQKSGIGVVELFQRCIE